MNDPGDQTCPFCGDQVVADTFMETPSFRAIYNIAPIVPGHSLVIPKRHVGSFLSLSDPEATEMVLFSRRVVEVLLPLFHADAFNWTIQEGEEAGQTVAHLHLHLIPRTPDDLPSPGAWYPALRASEHVIDSASRDRLSPAERHAIVQRIREAATRR